jgi:hypothetical protein
MKTPDNLGSFKDLKTREAKAVSDALQWEDLLNDVYEYCLPNRNLFNHDTKGAKKQDRVFDSTAPESIMTGASKMQANIAPIWQRWANLEPSNAVLRQLENNEGISEQDIRDNLQEQAEIMFDYIHRSNFSSQFYEACLDLLVGTCSLMIDEEESDEIPINFQAIPQISLAYEEGPNGKIETHWRRFKVKARNIERRWRGFEVKSELREIITDTPDADVEVTEGMVFDPKTGTYWGVAWTKDDESLSWVESFEDSSPWVTGRYSKTAGEIRGRGPAIRVMPDVKTLNKVKEFSLQKSAIDLSGMWTGISDGVFNPHTVQVSPGIVIPVSNNGTQNPSLQRLDTGNNLELSMFVISDLQVAIKKAFFDSLREPSDSVISASQYIDEARELAGRMGSAYGRIQSEVLIPILQRVYWILKRRGLVTPIKIGGEEVVIKFTSPLAKTQDSEDLITVQQAIEFTLATGGEEAVQLAFKLEDIGRWAGEKTGMPQELIRNQAEKDQMIQGAQALAEQGIEQEQPQLKAVE